MSLMTDPIADMLTRIRNALKAGHANLEFPRSRIKGEIARVLSDQGFIENYKVIDEGPQGSIRIPSGPTAPATKARPAAAFLATRVASRLSSSVRSSRA